MTSQTAALEPPLDPPATAPRGEARRRLILRSTLRVIADEGLAAVTHRRVAEVAGIPFSSITYWFASLEELIDAAFRNYLDDLTAFLTDMESEFRHDGAGGLIDFLVELRRREFTDPTMVRAEYELVLAATRDATLAKAFVSWERLAIGRLAEVMEQLGAPRPIEGARTLVHLVRASELDALTRPSASEDELRARLEVVLPALLAPRPSPTSTADPRRHPDPGADAAPVTDTAPAADSGGSSRATHAPARRHRR